MPPKTPPTESKSKLKRELIIFFVFLALLLAVAGYWLISSGSDGRQPLWGLARHLAWGAPTCIIALGHFIGAMLLISGFHRSGVLVGSLAAVSLAGFYISIMIASTGAFPMSLITVVILAVPVAVIHRAIVFLRSQS